MTTITFTDQKREYFVALGENDLPSSTGAFRARRIYATDDGSPAPSQQDIVIPATADEAAQYLGKAVVDQTAAIDAAHALVAQNQSDAAAAAAAAKTAADSAASAAKTDSDNRIAALSGQVDSLTGQLQAATQSAAILQQVVAAVRNAVAPAPQ